MKKYLRYLRNKYILTITLFVLYSLFLDDVDIFTIVRQNSKLSDLKKENRELQQQLSETRNTLEKLEYPSGLERYAREKKLFKKDDEDVFVISYE